MLVIEIHVSVKPKECSAISIQTDGVRVCFFEKKWNYGGSSWFRFSPVYAGHTPRARYEGIHDPVQFTFFRSVVLNIAFGRRNYVDLSCI